jgi:hypothetical protein
MNAPLQKHLEEYLKREGLFDIIPEWRRRNAFPFPIVTIWLLALWVPSAVFILARKGLPGLVALIAGWIIAPFAACIILYYLLSIVGLLPEDKVSDKETVIAGRIILWFFLRGVPLLISVALGIYLGSWLIAILNFALYFAITKIAWRMFERGYHLYHFYSFINSVRSTFVALYRSLMLLRVLIPALMVLVILSIFSAELWQALGSLSVLRLIGIVLCITVPLVVFILTSLQRETAAILSEPLTTEQILPRTKAVPAIGDELKKGHIDKAEWDRLTCDVEWRDIARMTDYVLPTIKKKVRHWLGLHLAGASAIVLIAFFAYFAILFGIMFNPPLLAEWTGEPQDLLLTYPAWYTDIPFLTVTWATVKVSLVLALLMSAIFCVQILTKENAELWNLFTELLEQKVSSWLPVSYLYLCAISPNYQIWDCTARDDKRKSQGRPIIIVPKDSTREVIKEACEHMASCLDRFDTITVAAFEINPERPIYKLDEPHWRLVHSKDERIKEFSEVG